MQRDTHDAPVCAAHPRCALGRYGQTGLSRGVARGTLAPVSRVRPAQPPLCIVRITRHAGTASRSAVGDDFRCWTRAPSGTSGSHQRSAAANATRRGSQERLDSDVDRMRPCLKEASTRTPAVIPKAQRAKACDTQPQQTIARFCTVHGVKLRGPDGHVALFIGTATLYQSKGYKPPFQRTSFFRITARTERSMPLSNGTPAARYRLGQSRA